MARFELCATIPEHLRCTCPQCGLVNFTPEDSLPHRTRCQNILSSCHPRRQSPTSIDAQCAYCQHRWDPRAAAGDTSYDERLSLALIRVTSKACPNRQCSQRISHFHGHACHHISPVTNGCPACHLHFCYVCLRKHGSAGHYSRNWRCPHGSSFCIADDILSNLIMEPYPRDRRCGCPICPHCAPHTPCAQCDGGCVVCRGIVPPGPLQLSAATLQAIERSDACKACQLM